MKISTIQRNNGGEIIIEDRYQMNKNRVYMLKTTITWWDSDGKMHERDFWGMSQEQLETFTSNI